MLKQKHTRQAENSSPRNLKSKHTRHAENRHPRHVKIDTLDMLTIATLEMLKNIHTRYAENSHPRPVTNRQTIL